MRFSSHRRLAVLVPLALLAAPAVAGAGVICNPTEQVCDRIVPTVDIQAKVQADKNNSSTIDQNSDVNMQGTVQGGRNNKSTVRQNGSRLNSSSTSQSQPK